MKESDVTIIVPAYNEEEAIGHVATLLKQDFPGCKIPDSVNKMT